MSRIGKKPIAIPAKVKVTVNGLHLLVEGPAGKLERDLHPAVKVTVANNQVVVERVDDERVSRSVHGLTRTLIDNMIAGCQKPFEKTLEITGVGYRAELIGKALKLLLPHVGAVAVAAAGIGRDE